MSSRTIIPDEVYYLSDGQRALGPYPVDPPDLSAVAGGRAYAQAEGWGRLHTVSGVSGPEEAVEKVRQLLAAPTHDAGLRANQARTAAAEADLAARLSDRRAGQASGGLVSRAHAGSVEPAAVAVAVAAASSRGRAPEGDEAAPAASSRARDARDEGRPPRFLVSWEIDVEDEGVATPEAAARKALRIQRDPESIATVFEVRAVDENGAAFGPRHIVDLTSRTVQELEEPEATATT
jgi:hypothetical protein